jgi:hypothetical protein
MHHGALQRRHPLDDGSVALDKIPVPRRDQLAGISQAVTVVQHLLDGRVDDRL